MPYVIAATWKAKPGEEDAVLGLLQQAGAASRQEPGCLLFLIHRSPEHADTFFLYEQFVDEAAFQAHTQTAHFKELVIGDAVNRLAERRREIFETI